MKTIPTKQAIGMVLCQDITKIVPGEFKGRAFKKGHIIKEEDVEELLKMGKENIYVLELKEGEIHEEEAAIRISMAVSGDNISFEEPYEGKVTLKSKIRGLLKVDTQLLYKVNSVDMITIASLPNNFTVEPGQKIAGARVVPLIINEEAVKKVDEICDNKKVFNVKTYKKLRVGIIATGNEVYKGRIEDKFSPIILKKIQYFGAELVNITYSPDDIMFLKKQINEMLSNNADLIILTGGMSVDADDLTPKAIKECSEQIITYGAPVQPGNMFMMAYNNNSAIIGVPGAALYYKNTILDIVLPRIFAGEILTKDDFIKMGAGGFCLGCKICTYPNCYFGRY